MNDHQSRVAQMYDDIDRLIAPPTMDAWGWLVHEIGEILSALMQLGYGLLKGYARNNPARHEDPRGNLILEMGQSLMMLCALANSVGLDLDDCLDRAIGKMYASHGDNTE